MLDANGQSLAYVYGRETKADADIAHVLTMDQGALLANIAKLPIFLPAPKKPRLNEAARENLRYIAGAVAWQFPR